MTRQWTTLARGHACHDKGSFASLVPSHGRIQPSIGSLYLAIQRLEEQGLIEESSERPAVASDDARRRYYLATELGRRVAAAEAERLAGLLDIARDRNLLR